MVHRWLTRDQNYIMPGVSFEMVSLGSSSFSNHGQRIGRDQRRCSVRSVLEICIRGRNLDQEIPPYPVAYAFLYLLRDFD